MKHFKLEIRVKGKPKKPFDFSVPESFDECSKAEVLEICRQRLRNSPAKLKKQFLAVYFSEMELLAWMAIPAEQKAEITVHLGWMLEKEQVFDRTLIPSINVAKQECYGPADQLTNLTFIEYIHADGYFHQWLTSSEEKFLYQLAAILYRPKKDGKRIPFDYEECNERAADWHGRTIEVKPEFIFALVTYFVGCQQYLATSFEDLFPEPSEEELEEYSPKKGYNNPWPNAQKRLAADGKLGTLAQLQKENLYNALDFLQDIVINDRKNALR